MTDLDRPVRVGLIGCGVMGGIHLQVLARLGPDVVTLVGLCDLDAERLSAAHAEFPQATAAPDCASLLAQADLDLVILCTMPNTHFHIGLAVLEAGVHLLVEKPFVMNASEASALLNAAEQAGRGLQVGTNMRYMPHNQYLHNLYSSGNLGQALQCRVWASHQNPPWWGPHYVQATSGGGVLASTLVHPLDTALWTCGYPQPVTVSASARQVFPAKRGVLATPEVTDRYDVEDLLTAHIRCADGFTIQMDGNWCDDTGDRLGFELACTRGTVRSTPLEVFTENTDGTITSDSPELAGSEYTRRRRWRMTQQLAPGQFPDIDEDVLAGWMRSVEAQDADVVGCIRHGRTLSMQDRRQLLILQRLIDACYESAREGHEVTI